MLSQLYRQRLRSCENKLASVISAPARRCDTRLEVVKTSWRRDGISPNEGEMEANAENEQMPNSCESFSTNGEKSPPAITAKSFWLLLPGCSLSLFAVAV